MLIKNSLKTSVRGPYCLHKILFCRVYLSWTMSNVEVLTVVLRYKEYWV